MNRQQQKLKLFVEFCDNLAGLSTCKRAKCGAIIFDEDFTSVRAIGYNGPPVGTDNASCTGEAGACGCCHAEANALIKLTDRSGVLRMYSTTMPCAYCAGLIVNSRIIKAVLYKDNYRDDRGMWILERAGIIVGGVK